MIQSDMFRYGLVLLVGLLLGFLVFGGDRVSNQDYSDHAHSQGESSGELWACSMHPQIRQNGPGKCPLCGMNLTPINSEGGTDGGGSDSNYTMSMTPESVKLADIRTIEVVLGRPERGVRVPGKVVVPETGVSVVSAQVSGRVIRQMADFVGKSVSKGDVLLTIWSPELISAQRELIDAVQAAGVEARGGSVSGDVNGSVDDGRKDLFVEAVRNKLRFWQLSDDQIKQIEDRGKVLQEVEIRSPRDGVVLRRNVRRDDVVSPGQVLYDIADLSTVWMEFEVFERDFGLIREGQRVRYGGLSRGEERMTGVVDWIDPVMDNEKRTNRVRVLAQNNDGKWSPGMLLEGEIMVNVDSRDMVMVPESSVLWTGPRSVVYVQVVGEEHPTFELREVHIGDRVGDMRVILDGVAVGEKVVIHGAFKIDAEFQLQGKASMMAGRGNGEYNTSGGSIIHKH